MQFPLPFALTPQPSVPGVHWVAVDVPTGSQIEAARKLCPGYTLSVYLPTDQPVYQCPETGRIIRFAHQLEVLRRCQLLFHQVNAVGLYPSLIHDALLYVESVAAYANALFWFRNTEADETEKRLSEDIEQHWLQVGSPVN